MMGDKSKFWSAEARKISSTEVWYVRALGKQLSDSEIDELYVREFIVDNAHYIQNAAREPLGAKYSAGMLINDEDGAQIDVLLFLWPDGGFCSLDFIRLDTKPLLSKEKLRN